MDADQLLEQYKDLLLSTNHPDLVRIFDQVALNYLTTADPAHRLNPMVVEAVKKSVVDHLVAPSRVGRAFVTMETYAKNIYLMPWKKEFHVITTYSAVYKNDLEPTLPTLSRLLTSLDYTFDAAKFVWRWTDNSEKLRYLRAGLHFKLATVECQLLDNVIREIYPLSVPPSLVYEVRSTTAGSDRETVAALRRRVLRNKQSSHVEPASTTVTKECGDSSNESRHVDKVKRIRFKDAEEKGGGEDTNVAKGNAEARGKYLDYAASHFIDDDDETEEVVFLPPKLSVGRVWGMEGLEGRVASLNLMGEGAMLPPKKLERSPIKATGNLIPDLIRSNYGTTTASAFHYTNFKAPPPPPPPFSTLKHHRDLYSTNLYSNEPITASNDLYSRHPDLDSRNIVDLDMTSPRDLLSASRDVANANTMAKGILSVRNLTYAPSSGVAVANANASVGVEGEKKTRFHVDL